MSTGAQTVFTARMIRELKGAPLACLVLLMISGQPVSNEWLCMYSGYTDKPVSQALKMLASPEYQLVTRTLRGWRLSDGFQEILMNRNISVPATALTLTDSLINDSDSVAASRKNSDSLNPHFEGNLETCKRLSIGEPSASTISDLFLPAGQPVTPEYIQAHVDSLERGEGKGLAIVRMKNGEPPKLWEKTEETEEDRRKYISGKFADYVEH